MKIRDFEMPSQFKLEELSSFLVDFYSKNIISASKLQEIYDIYYKFKQKFLNHYPGNALKLGTINSRNHEFSYCLKFRCKHKRVWLDGIRHLL